MKSFQENLDKYGVSYTIGTQEAENTIESIDKFMDEVFFKNVSEEGETVSKYYKANDVNSVICNKYAEEENEDREKVIIEICGLISNLPIIEVMDDLVTGSQAVVSEDCISREWVKENMIKYGFLAPDMTVAEFVADAPSVTAEQSSMVGEWIRNRYWSRGAGMGEEYGFFYKCSLCKCEVENGYTWCSFNFCPYCGAKMKG